MSKKHDTTSDITGITDDAVSIKIYRAVTETNENLTARIHEVDKKVDNLATRFDTILPELATEDHVEVRLGKHKEKCRSDRKKSDDRITSGFQRRSSAKAIGTTGGIAAALWALVEIIRNIKW